MRREGVCLNYLSFSKRWDGLFLSTNTPTNTPTDKATTAKIVNPCVFDISRDRKATDTPTDKATTNQEDKKEEEGKIITGERAGW